MFEVGPPSKMLKELAKIKEWIMDILMPKMCLGCGREGHYICKDCEIFLSEVNLIEAKPQSNTVSVWEYEGIIEKAISKIKYDGCYDIINELVEKAFEKITLELPVNTYITYVPMYNKKERWRGFNQAELIAKKLGEMTGRPAVKLLEKTRDNRSQVGLDPQKRIENVKGVFSTVSLSGALSEAKPQSILVADDVYTTGATMGECTKTLKKAGIRNVYGFTLARKLRI